MATSQAPAPQSTFRTVALVISSLAFVGFLLTMPMVLLYGGQILDLGWGAARVGGKMTVTQVAPGGPAEGRLLKGDTVIAWNGDRRVDRLAPIHYRRVTPFDNGYTLTVVRDGRELAVPLTMSRRYDRDIFLLTGSFLAAASVWIVVATMIALFRPDQTLSRAAYAAGMGMGLFMLSFARGPSTELLPAWWRTALSFVFPFVPMHLAVGYDFYMRFPAGITTTAPWRVIRIALYAVCAALCVTGPLLDTVVLAIAPGRYLDAREAVLPILPLLRWPANVIYPFAGLAIVAVVTRNYRAVTREDDRRRLRWVLWGTVVGLFPFLVLQISTLIATLGGPPVDFRRWNPLVNLATALIPISFGYAIIKHHVFDITFVVRRGLRYLLAKNALRFLLAAPIAGLAYGLIAPRDQPLGQLLWSNSLYLYLIVAAIASLRFRRELTRWLDRRFFREAYDRERILVELIDQVESLESASGVSKLVSQQLEAVFHPQSLFIWYREGDRPNLTLSYSSGGYIHSVELSPASPLLQLAERASGVIELPLAESDPLPRAEREWLDEAGVRLIVPMAGLERHMAGVLMLGDKKSDEPYSSDDLRLLQAIARQIAVGRENVRLKERVDRDRQLRHDVLAHLDTAHINVLKECPLCGSCYDASVTACATDGAELTLSLPIERTVDGKYRLDRLIGKGGMGAVYEAADLRLARSVAIKIMLGRNFGNRQALKRFEREAQASARLTHPNIVTVFDYGAVGADGAFLVMELVQGRTLRAEFERRGSLPPAVAAAWLAQICEGVAAAHERNVIHRDLKPENVLIAAMATGGDRVKVLDFGLAKIRAAGEDSGLTQPGVIMGTAAYMAPEQLAGGEVDQRADVFALGVMAAEAVTGQRPFRGRTYDELLRSISNDPITLQGDGPGLRRLEAVLRSAMASDRAGRYSSVADLAGDLIPALKELSVSTPDPSAETTLPRT